MQKFLRPSSPALLFALSLLMTGLLAGCDREDATTATGSPEASAPPIVTGDIKEGIEAHIAREVADNDGYFLVPFEGDELKLKSLPAWTWSVPMANSMMWISG